jgi:hypothetical protein
MTTWKCQACGHEHEIDGVLAERDRRIEDLEREVYSAWANGAEAALERFASCMQPPTGPEVDYFFRSNPHERKP